MDWKFFRVLYPKTLVAAYSLFDC